MPSSNASDKHGFSKKCFAAERLRLIIKSKIIRVGINKELTRKGW